MIKLKCDEVLKRNFSNLFDYQVERCNKCNIYNSSYIGKTLYLEFKTNNLYQLIENLSSFNLEKTLIYIKRKDHFFNDLDDLSELDYEKIIVIEEIECNFEK